MYESDPMKHGICMRPVQSWPAVKMFAMGAAFLLDCKWIYLTERKRRFV
jgi:hypothetical protein